MLPQNKKVSLYYLPTYGVGTYFKMINMLYV